MQIRRYLVFVTMVFANGAYADARFATVSDGPTSAFRLEYAQVGIDDIDESDLRRLVFYADRASRTLQDLVEGSSDRNILEQDKMNQRFRESISRLADAGARSGLSMDQVADFFTQSVFDHFGQSFMQQVSAVAGGLDFRTLFRNVSTVPNPRTHLGNSGTDLMNALADASKDLELTTPSGETGVIATPAARFGPQPFANANAAERAIVDRIQVDQGRWELTVGTGDSLSLIASAIYGDSLSYTTIYNANVDVLNSPNIIDVGTVLVLPQP